MRTLPALLIVLILSACATPERRIRAQPEIFAALTAEQQVLIRQGRVDLGFPAAAVQLAMGSPHRVFSRRTAAGETDVWSYVRLETRTESRWVDVRSRRNVDSVLVSVDHTREVETLRLEFNNGAVSAIESLTR